ncbi:acyloxyacyl hydrolase [Ramlibacter montanisoli]|uniref:Acyloxyacyl hydrolase n=1 Tax=Ramlibacter montanisoli TaxID=2732512 RepID=A0A849K906_9BURK|nr:acyloxyacyl hydrolase [Ramlibacter montanisoli]NNU41966.1 acyloxyacyl hydrolase [Ramlibacter montanisoli]
MNPVRPLKACLAALALGAATAASASTALPFPEWVFVEGGMAHRGGSLASVGLGWRLPWGGATPVGRFSSRLEAHVTRWSLPTDRDGRWRTGQLVLVPLVRHTWQTVLAPLFVEGGIGVSYLHDPAPDASTRWNFHDTVAIGALVGPLQRYELSLRLVHQSNAGLRKPNPGMNSVQLRFALAF